MRLRHLIFFIFFISSSLSFSQNRTHIGTWETLYESNPIRMVLDKYGVLTFKVGNKILGGNNYVEDGKLLSMHYKAEYSKSKITLTIIIKDKKKNKVIKKDTGILTFIDPNNITLCFKKPIESEDDESTLEYANDCRSFLKIK
jgi:hypothetical protein